MSQWIPEDAHGAVAGRGTRTEFERAAHVVQEGWPAVAVDCAKAVDSLRPRLVAAAAHLGTDRRWLALLVSPCTGQLRRLAYNGQVASEVELITPNVPQGYPWRPGAMVLVMSVAHRAVALECVEGVAPAHLDDRAIWAEDAATLAGAIGVWDKTLSRVGPATKDETTQLVVGGGREGEWEEGRIGLQRSRRLHDSSRRHDMWKRRPPWQAAQR